jgi:hypothetical protein
MSRSYLVPILLPADPAAPMEAATKQYVDAKGAPDEVVVSPDDPLVANPDVNLWYDEDAPDAPFGEVAVDVADPGFTVDLWYDPDAPAPVGAVDTEWSETEDYNTGTYDEAGTYFVDAGQVGLSVNVDGILETFTIPSTSSLLADGKMQRFTPYTSDRVPIQQRYHNGTAWQAWVPTQDQLATAAADFNDITVPGVYTLLGDGTNGPGPAVSGQLEVRSSDRTGLTVNFAAAGITQAWTDYATGVTYKRSATSGTYPNVVWTAWNPTQWIALPLTAGWTNLGSYQPAQYRRVGDVVELRGTVVQDVPANTVITNMPAGFRPSVTRMFGVLAFRNSVKDMIQRVDLGADGNMVCPGAAWPDAYGYLTLDQVSYSTSA